MRQLGYLGFFCRGFGESLRLYLPVSVWFSNSTWLPGPPWSTTPRGTIHITVYGPGFGTVALSLNFVSLPRGSDLVNWQPKFGNGFYPLDAAILVIFGVTLCKAETDPEQSLNPQDSAQVYSE